MPLLALLLSTLAGIIDARKGVIPNWLTLPALGLGLAGGAISSGWRGLLVAFLGALLTGLVPLLAFFLTKGRALGGGDVKCLIALGALLGPGLGLTAELWALSLLLLFALFRAVALGELGALLRSTLRLALRRPRSEAEPALVTWRFGPALALGTFGALFAEHFPLL